MAIITGIVTFMKTIVNYIIFTYGYCNYATIIV